MAKKKTSAKAIGDELEQRVGIHYEALGFQVRRDVLLAGLQIDLLATRHLPGYGPMTIAIEVKSRALKLGVNGVTLSIQRAKFLLDAGVIKAAVLVTDAVVSRQARLAINSQPHLTLLTLSNLEQDLFNNAEALFRVVNDYESKSIFASYYSLSATADQTDHGDVAEFIETWARKDAGLLLLIGDFGSGKSTILERVFYSAAKSRIADHAALFPVLLRLRGLRRFSELWQFVEASLRDTQYISPPRLIFDHELEKGRLLLLLDGFDEIYSGATAYDRANYLDLLKPLLKSKSPVALSSRPTFFQSFDDLMRSVYRLEVKHDRLQRLPDFGVDISAIAHAFGTDISKSFRRKDFAKVLEIKQLDKAQVRHAIARQSDVIKHNVGMSVEQFEKHLYSIYDLEDLMRRPLLLDMILRTMATGVIDIKSAKTVTASTLYDVYTQQAAFRDRKRAISDQLLTPELRIQACRALARAMYDKGDILLTAAEVEATVRRWLSENPEGRSAIKDVDDIASVVTDIRTCSFLRFADDNALIFAHKSFYEFFIAQAFSLASSKSAQAFLRYPRHRMTPEIIYFLASFAHDQAAFAVFLKNRLHEFHNEPDRSFLYCLAFASGEVMEGMQLSGGTVEGVTLAKASIRTVAADNLRMAEVTMRQVKCTDWKFKEVRLAGCQFNEVDFEDSQLAFASFGTSFDKLQFTRCDIKISGGNLSLADTTVEYSSISLNSHAVLTGCKFKGGNIEFGSQARVFGDRNTAIQMTISATSEHFWYQRGCRIDLTDCALYGLGFSGSDIFKSRQGRGERYIGLRGCSGVVYLETTEGLEEEGITQAIHRENRSLFILNNRFLPSLRKSVQAAPPVRLSPRLATIRGELSEHVQKWEIDVTLLPLLLRQFLAV